MNFKEESYREERFMLPLCEQTATAEVSGEYTLPDYLPQIRRILHVVGQTPPPSRYVGDGELELDGAVEYTLLYMGEDGGLYTAPLRGEYTVRLPLMAEAWDRERGLCVLTDVQADGLTARAMAPRRLSIRCRVCVHANVFAKEMSRNGEDSAQIPEDWEVLTETVTCADLLCGTAEITPLIEEIPVEGGRLRVIGARAEVATQEVTAQENEARCRGLVMLEILACDEATAETMAIRKSLPFEESIPMEGMQSGFGCKADGWITDVTLSVEEDKIRCDASGVLQVYGQRNREHHYTADLYSVKGQTQTVMQRRELPYAVGAVNGNFTQNLKLRPSEIGMPADATVLAVYMEGVAEAREQDGNKLTYSGACRYTVLWSDGAEYGVSQAEEPFRYTFSCERADATNHSCRIFLHACRQRSDGELLNLDAEIGISTLAWGKVSCEGVAEVMPCEEKSVCRGEMVVCFPTPQERIWDVAKRYAVPLSRLASYGKPHERAPENLLIRIG